MAGRISVNAKNGVILDKRRLAVEMDELLVSHGIEEGPKVTHEELMALMLAEGVRPNDNVGSRDILRARYDCDDKG